MNAHRYFLLGQTQREQLSQRLGAALQSWHEAWWPGAAGQFHVESGPVAAPEWAHSLTDNRFAMHYDDRKAGWVRLLRGQSSALLDQAAGGNGAAGGALAEKLGYRLIADLVARVLGTDSARVKIDSESGVADQAIFGPGGDAIGVVLCGHGIEVELLLLADAVKTFAPGPQPRALPRNAFSPMDQALIGQTSPLSVTLDLPGGVLLDEIRDLTEGHILVLDVPPSAAWTIVGAGDVRLGSGRPGRVGDRMAVQLFTSEKR